MKTHLYGTKDNKIYRRLSVLLFVASIVFALFFVYDIVLQAMTDDEPQTPTGDSVSVITPTEPFIGKAPIQLYVSDKVMFLAHLTVDGKDYTYPFRYGDGATVQTLLDRAGITLTENDYINDGYTVTTPLFEDIYVEIGRISYETVTTTVPIPYETEIIPVSYRLYRLSYGGYYDSASRAKYSEREGQNGVKTITTRIKYVDGVPVSSTKISEKITKQPVTAIKYQDINYKFDRRDGPPTEYLAKYNDLQVTSYYSSSVGGKFTKSGKECQIGRVAADTSVYPIGTKLYIVLPDGFVYGYCTVEDTGGAVKGNIIDLFFDHKADSVGRLGCTHDDSCRNCKNYGTCVEFCTVYVIEWGKDKNGNELPHK